MYIHVSLYHNIIIYTCIYIYMCVCVCIYIYLHMLLLDWKRQRRSPKQQQSINSFMGLIGGS